MMHHFRWFQHFWSQSIILLGHHFSGSRCYFLVAHHFTETSFYWNNFVLQIWVHHFTTQLLKIPAVSIILQVHFCYTETNRNQHFFHTKPVGGGPNVRFPLGNRHCSTTSIILLNSSPKLQCVYSWVVSSWNNTNPHYECTKYWPNDTIHYMWLFSTL